MTDLNELIRYCIRRDELKHRAAEEFGESHGWTLAPRPFSWDKLARGSTQERGGFHSGLNPSWLFDHAEFYNSRGRPAGIVAHLYGPVDKPKIRQWADEHGLAMEFPKAPSWYSPGDATLVLYTQRSN